MDTLLMSIAPYLSSFDFLLTQQAIWIYILAWCLGLNVLQARQSD